MKGRPQARRRSGLFRTLTRAFVWVVLVIFILTSVGVALITVR